MKAAEVGRPKSRMPARIHLALGTPCTLGAKLLEENVVLHEVGRHIVSYELALHKMNFLHEFPANVDRVTALAIIDSRKYIAMCEVLQNDNQPQVRVVHLRSRKSVSILSAQVDTPFEACCFSEDGKYLLACTSGPDQFVVVFHWVEERPVGMLHCKTPISRVHFSPATASLLSTSHPIKLARMNDMVSSSSFALSLAVENCPSSWRGLVKRTENRQI